MVGTHGLNKKHMNATYQNTKEGDTVKFKGTHHHWFTNWIKDAETNLKIGAIYTVSHIQVNSSSTSVQLKETGDSKYSLSFFEK